MTHQKIAITLGIALALSIGCGADIGGPPEDDGLAIGYVSDTEVEGWFRDGAVAIEFSSAEVEPGVVQLDYMVNNVAFSSRIDLNQGIGSYDLPAIDLTASFTTRFAKLHDALGTVFATDTELTKSADQLARSTSFLSVAPVGETAESFTFQTSYGWTYLSCSCRNQYIGSGHYRTAGKGNSCTGGSGNGCKGRCGASCGWYSGRGAYTRDCAKHDWRLGSWWRASDDYSFASWNC